VRDRGETEIRDRGNGPFLRHKDWSPRKSHKRNPAGSRQREKAHIGM
jgi:hypothetical protein